MHIFAGEIQKDLLLEGPCLISGLWQLCIRIKRELFKARPINGLLKIRNATATNKGLHYPYAVFDYIERTIQGSPNERFAEDKKCSGDK